MRFAAGRTAGQLWAFGTLQETLRENVFPTVCPSGILTSRPAIRVNGLKGPPPKMVLSVTVIGSENERAQPINRP